MKVAFRVDSSEIIGSGHLFRCLTLTEELASRNAELFFICRELPGNLIDELTSRNYKVFNLPYSGNQPPQDGQKDAYQDWLGASQEEDARQTAEVLQKLDARVDWLVTDHYALDRVWETKIKKLVQHLLVIDDLADRPHSCDILLDQNLQGEGQRYKLHVPSACTQLLGPQFTLLRPEFVKTRQKAAGRDGTVKNILIFFGGIDPTNETAKAIEAILRLKAYDISLSVVVGKKNPHLQQIEQLCSRIPRCNYFCQVDNMAELMVHADLAIGAGGTTAWERCAMGLPSLMISIAENQDQVCTNLNTVGAAVYLGKKDTVSAGLISDTVADLRDDPERIKHLSRQAYSLVDTLGAGRVVDEMLRHTFSKQASGDLPDYKINLRKALPGDKQQVFAWRNVPTTRRFFFNPAAINWDEHSIWYDKVLQAEDCYLLIGEIAKIPVGTLRFDISGKHAEISVYLVPNLTGKGLGSALIKKGNEWLRANLPAVRTIKAKVRSENKASINAFKKAGYDCDSYNMLYKF